MYFNVLFFVVRFIGSRVLSPEAEREQSLESEDVVQLHGPARPLRDLRGKHSSDHGTLLLQDFRRETQLTLGFQHAFSCASSLHSSRTQYTASRH